METWLTALIVCGLYLIITLITGLLTGRNISKSVTGFVAGDRSMNVVVLYFVMGASIFSAFAFLGGPGWAYSRGAAAYYIIAYGIVGIIPLYFFGPKTRRIGAKLGFVTQAELLSHRYGSRLLSVMLALLSIIVFIPYLTLQMKGAGYILETISDGYIPDWVGALITYSIVLIYVFRSGVMGIGWTNAFQGVFMMIIAWFLGLYLPNKLYGGVGPMFEQLAAGEWNDMLAAPGLTSSGAPWDWWGFSSAVVVSAFGFSMWPHLFMKSYAAKSDRSLRLTVVLYPTFQIFLVPILLIGFSGIIAFAGVSPADTIVPHILKQESIGLSGWIVGLVCAGTLAASMSSGDAILHAAASIGIRDGVNKMYPDLLNDQQQRKWIQVLIIVISAIAYYFAVFSEVGIVQLLLGSYGGVAQIFPLIFAAFYWPRGNGKGAVAGLVAGLVVNMFFLIQPEFKPFPMHEGIYGLLANILVFVTVSLLTPPEPLEKLKLYTHLAEEEAPAAV
ncbi:MAG: sodium:solute symporter family protein [Bacteroidota bacterium]